MYYQIETISDLMPFWQLSEIKKMTVREREHWFKRAVAKFEAQQNKS